MEPAERVSKKVVRFLTPSQDRRRGFGRYLKILLFHSSFTFIVCLYVTLGALAISYMENSSELNIRTDKLDRILHLREQIIQRSSKLCHKKRSTMMAVEKELKPLLKELSFTHEYDNRFTMNRQKWTNNPKKLKPKWTFMASVVYAVTVLTATGYDRLSPRTDPGRLFAIAFGTFGIPLMLITAANIGKFLSRLVIWSSAASGRLYRRGMSATLWSRRMSTFSVTPPPVPVAALDRLQIARESVYGVWLSDSHTAAAAGKEEQGEQRNRSEENGEEGEGEERRQVPAVLVISIIAVYCCMGSILFTTFENGPIWSFAYGFYFSFITISTITVGDIQVDNWIYLGLVLVYCIVGLAIITMCIDLASVRFKVVFIKLHYYGRKWALMRAKSRSDMEKRLEKLLEEAAAVAGLVQQYKEKQMNAGLDTQSTIDEDDETDTKEEGSKSPSFDPLNIQGIPWMDGEQDDTTIQSIDSSSSG